MTRAQRGQASERDWMAQALALAALAEGSTSPNPRVGCVLVRGGRVVGRGFHRAPGGPHAEAEAVAEAGEAARGATLYVNLEPCAHHGRTPPCTELLVRCGVSRVVAAMQDPNPLVDGRGFERLRGAGIAVEVGLLEAEARRLNEPFVHWHERGRPWVTLKAAVSADGLLSGARGESRWITGPAARRFAHRLRRGHDAILVGAGTVRRDDPRLTVRLDGAEQVKLRVVVSSTLDLPARAAVFSPGPGPLRAPATRVYVPRAAGPTPATLSGEGIEVVRVDGTPSAVDLEAVLDDLGRVGVQSVLVEGGGRTLAAFLEAGLAGRAALFYADRVLGARGATPLHDRAAAARPELGWRLVREQLVPLGRDLLVLGRPEAPTG